MKKIFTFLLLLGFANTAIAQTDLGFEATPEYGRIYNITFDPHVENKLYAVSQGNHVLYSLDKGINWDILYSFPENYAMLKDMQYMQGNKLSFYVDNTISNSGVYILDLNSLTISKEIIPPVPQNADRHWISAYNIYEADTDVVLVQQGYRIGFTGYAKVYYTVDGGDNWQTVYYNEDYNQVFPNDVAISPSNPDKLFIARANGPNPQTGGLFISEDAGATWTESLAGITLDEITFHPIDPNNIFIATWIGDENQVQKLYRSLDNADTWQEMPITFNDETLDIITSITYNPTDNNNILVLEENEVIITTDNGATWSNYVYPVDDTSTYTFGLSASFNPSQPNEVFINADWHPMFSNDGGATLNLVPVPFYPTLGVGIYTGTEEQLCYVVQGGIAHKNVSTGTVNSYHVLPLDYVSNSGEPHWIFDNTYPGRVFGYIAGFSGANFYISNDHGETLTSLYQTFFDSILTVSSDPNNPNKVWASFLESGLMVFDFTDMDFIQQTSISIPSDQPIRTIYVDDEDPNIIYASPGNKMFKSEDAGATWQLINNGINLTASDAFLDIDRNPSNANELVAVSNQGIYRTTDAGANWTLVFAGLNVRKVKYSTVTSGQVIASVYTHDEIAAQILYSTDNGASWIGVPIEAIANTGSFGMDYKFNQDNIDIYISSVDLGVVKYTLDIESLSTPEMDFPSNGLRMYPNPATDVLYIDLDNDTAKEVIIFSTSGAKIFEIKNEEELDISQLSKGIYFVHVKTEAGKRIIKKLVKK